MNLIIICSDTFRADYLGCYGGQPEPNIQTPCLDKLAEQGVLFTDAYGEGLPTLPVRRVLLTGRRIFPFETHFQKSDQVKLPGWHPLFYEDVTLAEALRENGYTTGFVTDVYHMMKPGKNFHRGFHFWRWIRGQEADPYVSGPKKGIDLDRYLRPDTPDGPYKQMVLQYLMNRRDWKGEEDYFVAQVMREAAQWLEDNVGNQPLFLYVDCFDPHEPWDPPTYCAEKYYPNYDGIELICPPGTTDAMSESELKRVKALYAGEVTLVDRWIGYLLEKVDALNIADDTIILFTSDHGTMMGERGEVHKGPPRLRHQCTRVPLIIRHPDTSHANKKLSGFVQHQDIMPTMLSLLDVAMPDRVQGEDFWPMAAEGAPGLRDIIITSFGQYASVRTKDWNYVTAWTGAKGQSVQPAQLYNLNADPDELTDVIADHPEVAKELQGKLVECVYPAGGIDTTGTLGPGESPPEDDQSRL